MNVLAAGDVSPGVLGFIVVALIGVALYLLIKSMNKQISKIEVPSEAEARKAEAAEDVPAGKVEEKAE
ncbi:hypothetical protein [Nonomuraea rhizosphaerae]|uniref:hypothetical protein n=1 Tax=Nonomuraea rhizosphaerae TaxID=2665663 RepID=UPI001C5FAF26|nr:hypothetical protein [Nonomuraea rhizosphaerae]